MKNLLTRLLSVGLVAASLAACGPVANQTGVMGYNQFGMGGGNACLSSAQQQLSINFTAQGLTNLGGTGFYAGRLPQSHPAAGTYGTVTVGGGMQNSGGLMLQKQSNSGTMMINLNPQGSMASGTITISAQALYQTGIMNYLYSGSSGGYNTGYNTGMTNSVCVTSLGLDVIYSSGGYNGGYGGSGTINSALVYLYLSNGQVVPMPVQF